MQAPSLELPVILHFWLDVQALVLAGSLAFQLDILYALQRWPHPHPEMLTVNYLTKSLTHNPLLTIFPNCLLS